MPARWYWQEGASNRTPTIPREGTTPSVQKDDVLTEDVLKTFLRTLGTRIKSLRKDKKVSMRDIMVKTGYYDTQWRRYEAGSNINIPSLMKVAIALDVTLLELLGGLGDWPRVSVQKVQEHIGIEPADVLTAELESEPEQQPISRQRSKGASANGKRASSRVKASRPSTAKTTSASPVRSKRKPSQ